MAGNHADRVRGMLVGLAAGDQIGGPSRMALRLATSLVERGEFDPDDVAERYLRWWQRDGFDTGPVAEAVFSRRTAGRSTQQAVLEVHRLLHGRTAGCNPAHRVAPLAASTIATEDLAAAAAREARLTHHHPVAGDVAAAVALTCRALLDGAPWDEAVRLAAQGRLPETLAAFEPAAGEHLSTSGYAPEVLRAALHFVGVSGSFEEALARSLAFDPLSNYAPVLVGAVAGARWGVSAIPYRYLDDRAVVAELDRAARALAARPTPTESAGDPVAAVRARLLAAADHVAADGAEIDGDLRLHPVFGGGSALRYLTYAEADSDPGFRVDEHGRGSVPRVQVRNGTGHDVLLVEGEIIAGLRQNRTVNTSVLVPAGTDLLVDVTCVERGRWDATRRPARRAPVHLSPSVRAGKTASVAASMRAGRGAAAYQARVWCDVATNLERRGVRSPTDDFAAVDAGLHRQLPEPAPGQTGVVATYGRRVIAADLFDRHAALASCWAALVAGYRADAPVSRDGTPGRPDPATWLRGLAAAPFTVTRSAGNGVTVHAGDGGVTASALVVDGVVVHLSAFPISG